MNPLESLKTAVNASPKKSKKQENREKAFAGLTKTEQQELLNAQSNYDAALNAVLGKLRLALLDEQGENVIQGNATHTVKNASNPFGSGAFGLNVSGPVTIQGLAFRVSFSLTMDGTKDATRSKFAKAISTLTKGEEGEE